MWKQAQKILCIAHDCQESISRAVPASDTHHLRQCQSCWAAGLSDTRHHEWQILGKIFLFISNCTQPTKKVCQQIRLAGGGQEKERDKVCNKKSLNISYQYQCVAFFFSLILTKVGYKSVTGKGASWWEGREESGSPRSPLQPSPRIRILLKFHTQKHSDREQDWKDTKWAGSYRWFWK